MERAVPSIIFIARSTSYALRSLAFASAIALTCSRVTLPAFSRRGFSEPLSIPAAFLSMFTAGGVLRTNTKLRSSKTVISAGTTSPACCAVRSLYDRQNSMMLTPCGPSAVPTGGAGVALPAWSSIFRTVRIFFFDIALLRPPSAGPTRPAGVSRPPTMCGLVDLLDLEQVQLHGRLAPEHVDEHLELALLGVDLVDLAQEVGERPVHHPHALAELELDADLRLLLDLLEDRLELDLLQRHRLVAGAHEAGHAGRVPDDVPGLVGHDHLDQDVAGEDPLLDVPALAVLDLDLVLHRDEYLEDLVLHVHGLDPLLEVLLGLFLVAGVRVDDVPLRLGGCRRDVGSFSCHCLPCVPGGVDEVGRQLLQPQ